MPHMDDGTLHAHLDGELVAEEAAQMREHLATCADCRARLDAARVNRTRAHQILRYADPQGVVAPDFATLTAGRPARSTGRGPAPRVRPLLLPWAASLVLALGAGWFAQALLRGDGGAGDRVAAARQEAGAPTPGAAAAADAAPVSAETATDAARPAEAEDRSLALPRSSEESRESVAMSAETAPSEAPGTGAVATPPDAVAAGRQMAEGVAAGRAAVPEDRAAEGAAGAADLSVLEPSTTVARAPQPRGAGAEDSGGASERPDEERLRTERVAVTGAVRADTQLRPRQEGEIAALAAPPPPPAAPAAPAAPSQQGWPLDWRTVSRAAAERALGASLLTVASLETEGYQVGDGASLSVRVVQRLPGGEPLEILQRRLAPGEMTPSPGAEQVHRAADAVVLSALGARAVGFRHGNLEILLRAAVSADSLVRLREALR